METVSQVQMVRKFKAMPCEKGGVIATLTSANVTGFRLRVSGENGTGKGPDPPADPDTNWGCHSNFWLCLSSELFYPKQSPMREGFHLFSSQDRKLHTLPGRHVPHFYRNVRWIPTLAPCFFLPSTHVFQLKMSCQVQGAYPLEV